MFIELTQIFKYKGEIVNELKTLVNINLVTDISRDGQTNNSVIGFGSGDNDYIQVKESYETVKSILEGRDK